MMEHRADAQRAHVGDDHGAVEGAGLDQGIGDQAEVVEDAQHADRHAQQEARSARQRLGDLLGVVVFLAGLDLLDLLVELAVDIEDRVGGLEVHLDRGLGRVDGQRALDRHDDGDVVVRVDAAARDETVDARQHGDAADVRGDEEVQQADPLVAVHAQLAQAAVDRRDLEALVIEDLGVVPRGHDEGDELGEGRQRAQQASVSSVSGAFSGFGHGFLSPDSVFLSVEQRKVKRVGVSYNSKRHVRRFVN